MDRANLVLLVTHTVVPPGSMQHTEMESYGPKEEQGHLQMVPAPNCLLSHPHWGSPPSKGESAPRGGGDPFAVAEPGAVSSPADRFEPEPDLHTEGGPKEHPAEVLKTSKGESHVEEAREGLLMLSCLSPPCVIHEADDSNHTGNQREVLGEASTRSRGQHPERGQEDTEAEASVVSRKPRPLPELRREMSSTHKLTHTSDNHLLIPDARDIADMRPDSLLHLPFILI